jgi:bacterioferritin-associated ferredoxin
MNRDISQAIAWMGASETYVLTPPGNICRAARQAVGERRVHPVFKKRMRSDARATSPKRRTCACQTRHHDSIAEEAGHSWTKLADGFGELTKASVRRAIDQRGSFLTNGSTKNHPGEGIVYVCICNAFTEKQVSVAIDTGVSSPAGVFRHLGCVPQCGKCVPTVRRMVRNNDVPSPSFSARGNNERIRLLTA